VKDPRTEDGIAELPGCTRLTVVDYRRPGTGGWAVVISERDIPHMAISFQDDGRTLKIFISEKELPL
jgi:hypothetical protein